MAEKKSTQNKNDSSSKKSSATIFGIGLNKICFYTIASVGILYLVAAVLAIFSISSVLIAVLQNLGTAILICVTAFMAWNYVRSKPTVWKILYFVMLLLVVLGIIFPLVF